MNFKLFWPDVDCEKDEGCYVVLSSFSMGLFQAAVRHTLIRGRSKAVERAPGVTVDGLVDTAVSHLAQMLSKH